MDVQASALALAGYALSVATLNNLRRLNVLSDDQLVSLYDEVLLGLEEIQGQFQGKAEVIEIARRVIDREIVRERANRSDQGNE